MMIALGRAGRQAADFDQLQAERLDLGEYAVECGLVNEHARQDGLVSARPGLESGERRADRVAQVAADTDPVTLWPRIDELDGGLPDRT